MKTCELCIKRPCALFPPLAARWFKSWLESSVCLICLFLRYLETDDVVHCSLPPGSHARVEEGRRDGHAQGFRTHPSRVGRYAARRGGRKGNSPEGAEEQDEQLLGASGQFANDPGFQTNKIKTKIGRCKGGALVAYLLTCSCFHLRSGDSAPDDRMMSKSCFSASTPKTPSGSFRRNFLTTEEMV